MWFQAPTDRQLRYKEKVNELRRKRNSGLNKEQKEKLMVSVEQTNALLHIHLSTAHLPICPSLPASPGSPSESWDEQGAAAGEHHQRLRPRAVQESAGTCIGGPCKRENSSSPSSLTSFSVPLVAVPASPFLYLLPLLCFSLHIFLCSLRRSLRYSQ